MGYLSADLEDVDDDVLIAEATKRGLLDQNSVKFNKVKEELEEAERRALNTKISSLKDAQGERKKVRALYWLIADILSIARDEPKTERGDW